MNKGKRVLLLGLVLILALAVLAGCGKKTAGYEVLVTDRAGKPVAGAVIQFCSDTECIMGTTDEKGIASFDREAGTCSKCRRALPQMTRRTPRLQPPAG